MPNHYFRFKQFIVYQQHAAMKVTTDACLFGAVVADLPGKAAKKTVLDIGTGTGLLSLMFAQKNPQATIDAVEIDLDAATEAASNFAASSFTSQLSLHQTNIVEFNGGKKYDLIFCNPPFYEQDLKSPDEKRNKALHDATLTLNVLLQQIERLIAPEGNVAVLLPFHRATMFIENAKTFGLHCYHNITVHQTENHPAFRSIVLLNTKEETTASGETIIIKINNEYSNGFKRLLRDYYLYL